MLDQSYHANQGDGPTELVRSLLVRSRHALAQIRKAQDGGWAFDGVFEDEKTWLEKKTDALREVGVEFGLIAHWPEVSMIEVWSKIKPVVKGLRMDVSEALEQFTRGWCSGEMWALEGCKSDLGPRPDSPPTTKAARPRASRKDKLKETLKTRLSKGGE